MRTRTKKTTLLLSLVILLSTYFFASASLINIASNPDALKVVMYSPISDCNTEANFSFEDEAYIDDIPFKTEYTYVENKYEQAISIEFSLEEELYIDDIPQEIYKGTL